MSHATTTSLADAFSSTRYDRPAMGRMLRSLGRVACALRRVCTSLGSLQQELLLAADASGSQEPRSASTQAGPAARSGLRVSPRWGTRAQSMRLTSNTL